MSIVKPIEPILRQMTLEEEAALRTDAGQADHLLLDSRGQPLACRHWHRLLKRYAALAGFPDICPYEFRVFFGTAHFQLGTDQETVRKALRHKDAGMTRHYQRVSERWRGISRGSWIRRASGDLG